MDDFLDFVDEGFQKYVHWVLVHFGSRRGYFRLLYIMMGLCGTAALGHFFWRGDLNLSTIPLLMGGLAYWVLSLSKKERRPYADAVTETFIVSLQVIPALSGIFNNAIIFLALQTPFLMVVITLMVLWLAVIRKRHPEWNQRLGTFQPELRNH